jgi:anthranilate phosphoribosyltransferase
LRVENAEQSAAMLVSALTEESGVAHDIVALNAGAALYVSGQAKSIADGLEKAKAVMTSGAALVKMRQFVETTKSLGAA